MFHKSQPRSATSSAKAIVRPEQSCQSRVAAHLSSQLLLPGVAPLDTTETFWGAGVFRAALAMLRVMRGSNWPFVSWLSK